MVNSQCANTQTGLMLVQDGSVGSSEAGDGALPADALDDALDASGPPTDAVSEVGNPGDAANPGDASDGG